MADFLSSIGEQHAAFALLFSVLVGACIAMWQRLVAKDKDMRALMEIHRQDRKADAETTARALNQLTDLFRSTERSLVLLAERVGRHD